MADISGEPRDVVVFHATPANSETALVAFSSQGMKPGHFHFFGLLQHFPQFTTLLVRDPSENWFNTGLPDVGETVNEIAERLKQELSDLNAKRVLTIGSSMGGYAAILFACMIGAERAIALVPQTLLHPDLPNRAPSADVALQVPDLRPIICESPHTLIDVVAGWDDFVDVFHAQRVAEASSVRVLGVAGKHQFAEDLAQRGDFWPFMASLIEGSIPSVCEVKPGFETTVVEQLEEAALAFGRKDWRVTISMLTSITESEPSWSAPKALLDSISARIGATRSPYQTR